MTDLRELDVVELGQIEGGGDTIVCHVGVVCDKNLQNCKPAPVCQVVSK